MAVPPNRRLQLTAFGARDRAVFDTLSSAVAAAEARDVGPSCHYRKSWRGILDTEMLSF